ncbi:MAG: HAD family hydrolase [Bryobacteraceae bacterium]
MHAAVLWDLDGTLVDSEQLHWRAWRETMAAEGVAITWEQFKATFGQRNDSFVPLWLGEGATPERVARIGDTKEACYRRLVREFGLTPAPGAKEWVRRLQSEGWKQAIASSAPRENVLVMLEALGLADAFQAIVAAEDVTAGKPDPQVFLLAAERLGVPPGRCVVVEDAPAGIEAARRAGMRSIYVRGAGTSADLAVNSLADLPPDAFRRLIEP